MQMRAAAVLVLLKATLLRAVGSPSAPQFTAAPPLGVRAGVHWKEEEKREERKQARLFGQQMAKGGRGRGRGEAGGRHLPTRRRSGVKTSGQGREETERLWVIS